MPDALSFQILLAWERIPVNETGELEDNFLEAPDWIIEILSPEQTATRVIDKILHCLWHGSKLGWLVDPDDYAVLIFARNTEPSICRGDSELRSIEGVDLSLTAVRSLVGFKFSGCGNH